MQFLSSLLGGTGDTVVTAALALGIVLVLVVLGLCALKFFMQGTTALRPQGRRLQVVDQVQVDGRRQLLLIRRDNVEHVILTGGPQDLLIEHGIPAADRPAPQHFKRAQPAAAAPEEPGRPPAEAAAQPAPPRRPEPARPTVIRPQLERLRDLPRPSDTVRRSLRQTGLLRPVSVMEPAVIPMPPIAGDNSGRVRDDSATRPVGTDTNGRTGFGGQATFGDDGAKGAR